MAICEQTENVLEMEDRIKRETKDMTPEERRKVNKTVNREILHIYSKGTHFNLDADQQTLLGDYDAKYVLAFYQSGTKFGYCYFDMSTLNFYMGSFKDDFTLKQFRTLIMQIRPVEFICTTGAAEHTNIHAQETLKILRNCPSPPVATTFAYKDASEADQMLKRYFLSDQAKWPEAILKALKGEAKIALGLSIIFLDKLLLADTSIPIASFEWSEGIDGSFAGRPASMLIDAQAIEHLDILPPYFGSRVRKADGSLFSFLSQGCSTAFGKRMLKRWTVSPLYDVA